MLLGILNPAMAAGRTSDTSDKMGSFDISLLYMGALDDYLNFSGASVKFGLFLGKTTDLYFEFFGGTSLDTFDYYTSGLGELELESNLYGGLIGITQYLPLSSKFWLYIRANGGMGVAEETLIGRMTFSGIQYYGYSFIPPRHYIEEIEAEYTTSADLFIFGGGVGFNLHLADNLWFDCGCDYRAFQFADREWDELKEELAEDENIACIAAHAGIQFLF